VRWSNSDGRSYSGTAKWSYSKTITQQGKRQREMSFVRHGMGLETTPTSRFELEYFDSFASGLMVESRRDGVIIRCSARVGKCEGATQFRFPDGRILVGKYADGRWVGPVFEQHWGYISIIDTRQGQLTARRTVYEDGLIFEGEPTSETQSVGKLIYPSGQVAKGLIEGKKVVNGTLTYPSGTIEVIGRGDTFNLPNLDAAVAALIYPK